MVLSISRISAILLFAAAVSGQEPPVSAPIVQPGAPGHSNKTLSPSAVAASKRPVSDADTAFMQGMIHHHAQAVEMTDLMRTRTRNKDLLALGKRMNISQADEIKYM